MNGNSQDREGWEELYRRQRAEDLPWFYPGLDPDLLKAFKSLHITPGTVLDLCTGPGTQALALAELGFSVTATDIADTAVKQACEKAAGRGLNIRFLRNDIFDNRLEETFEFLFDRGCYHLFPEQLRRQYPGAVSRLLFPAGMLFLKCFSHLEPSRQGPHHISPEEIESFFGSAFELLSIKDTVFQSHQEAGRGYEPRALFCVMRKRLRLRK